LKIFRKHLLLSGSTIREALERLDLLAKDAIIFIVDENNRLIGSLTDGDVRRGLLKGFSIEDRVDDIIQPNPRYIRKEDCDFAKVVDYRDQNFRIIPIINKKNEVVNVINFREIKSYLPIDAVIMAGGRGERLKPLTDAIPKPLLKIGDKAIIDHNIDRLRLFGIDDIWVTSRYLGEQIIDHVGNGNSKNVRIHHVIETEPLGTIGSISQISNFASNYIMVLNADLLTNIDYEDFFLHFLSQEADLSVVTIPYTIQVPYAILESENGQIKDFKEKPLYTYYANGGVYLFKKELLTHIPIQKQFNSTDFMEKLINQNKKVISFPHSGYWLDIGTHDNYIKAQNDINTLKLQ
jgi:dTDP-glucose pyrophosphorylase